MKILSKVRDLVLRGITLLALACIFQPYMLAAEIGGELMVDLQANYLHMDGLATIIDSPKGVLVPTEYLEGLNLKDSYLRDNAILVEGKKYLNLKSLEKVNYDLDRSNLKLTIVFPPEAVKTQILDGIAPMQKGGEHKTSKTSGAFFDYDLLLTRSNINSISSIQDINYFTPTATLSHTYFLYIDSTKGTKDDKITRLQTFYEGDNQNDITRWRIGDGATVSSDWSGSTQFAGVQYGSHYAMRPGIPRHPLTSFIGAADSPTKVEIFADSVPIYQTEVNVGEFNIKDIPAAGTGNLLIRTTDILGRVRTFSMPYYIATTILTKDLIEHSLSLGVQRQKYGIENYSYQSYIGSYDYLKGITDLWTSGYHIDFKSMSSQNNLAAVGITNALNMKQYGVVSVSLAGSLPKAANAYKMTTNYTKEWNNINFAASFGLSGQNFIDPFAVNSFTSGVATRNFQTNVSYGTPKLGSFSVGYSVFSAFGSKIIKLVSANYSRGLTRNSTISLSMGKTLNKKKSSFINLSYNLNLEKYKSNLSLSSNKSAQGYTNNAYFSHPIQGDLGFGYSGSVQSGQDVQNYDMQLDKNFSNVDTSIFVFDRNKARATQQLDLRGTIIAMDNDIFFSRPFYGSIALVKSGGYPGITVYRNNNPVGKTNKNGRMVITDIAPYVPVKISLNADELPLTAQFSNVESHILIREDGGDILEFNVTKVRGLSMNLKHKDGTIVEMNEEVTLKGVEEKGYVGYEGLAYVSNIGDAQKIEGTACGENNKCCSFSKDIPEKADDYLIDLGEVTCE